MKLQKAVPAPGQYQKRGVDLLWRLPVGYTGTQVHSAICRHHEHEFNFHTQF